VLPCGRFRSRRATALRRNNGAGVTSFTVIDKRGATAISGTFSSLPDGGTLTIGSNTFAADYAGGDGIDLTLTVVP
jgi:hypothetical protein